MEKLIMVILVIVLSFQCVFAEIHQDSAIQNLPLLPYATEFEVQQKKNKVKNVSSNADWISIQKKKNKSGTYYIIRVTENTSDEERNSTLTIKTSKHSESIEIKQEGQNITNKFPDRYFRKALLDKGIISSTQAIYAREIRDISKLDLSDAKDKINSISGIEYFQKLRDLDCSSQQLKVIDLSKNKYIERLICSKQTHPQQGDYILTSIRLPDQFDKNTKAKFRELDYSYNHNGTIYNFDTGALPWLERLNCSQRTIIGDNRAPIVCLTPSRNPHLKELICSSCRLTNLDLSQYKDLEILDCSNNKLDTLDITHNKKLRKLVCDGNLYRRCSLSYIYIPHSTDSEFALEELYCANNKLSALDFSKFPKLKILDCSRNKFSALDFSKNYKLEKITCNSQSEEDCLRYQTIFNTEPFGEVLTSLILSDRPENALKTLICYGNMLTDLDLSNSLRLDTLHCSKNEITSLDLNPCVFLSYLNCARNIKLTQLDVQACTNLRELDCSYCNITSLDVSKQANLEKLYCIKQAEWGMFSESGREGALKILTLPENRNSKLKEINCKNNQLTTLHTGNLPNLTTLNCYSNRITQLDVSRNPLLSEVDCRSNYIQHLDFSNNPRLEKLKCGGQGYEWSQRQGDTIKNLKKLILPDKDINETLQELDYHNCKLENPVILENLPALRNLNCAANGLISVNLNNNKKLQRLTINKNRLTSLDLSGNPELINVDCTFNCFDEIDVSHNPLLNKLTCIHANNHDKKFTIWVGKQYIDGSIDFRPDYRPDSLDNLVVEKVVKK